MNGGAQAEACSCGTFAIGRCVDCSRAVCGDCSLLRDGRRLCRECSAASDRRVEAQRAEQARIRAEEAAVAAQGRAAAAAAARSEHDERVRMREPAPGTPRAWEMQSRRTELERRLRKLEGAGPSEIKFSTVLIGWLLATGVAYFFITQAAGGPDNVPSSVFAVVYVLLACVAVGIWFYAGTSSERRAEKRAALKAELTELAYERGCGERSCRHCYAGTASHD